MTYEVTVTAIPVNGTVDDGQSATLRFAKAAPQVGVVDAPVISIDPSAEQDGVYYVDSDFSISWSAGGDVAAYFLRITDGNTDFANGQVDYSSTSIPLSSLADGVTYEVTVTAIPVNGTVDDGQSATLRFAKAAPDPTEAPVEEAPVEEAPVEGSAGRGSARRRSARRAEPVGRAAEAEFRPCPDRADAEQAFRLGLADV